MVSMKFICLVFHYRNGDHQTRVETMLQFAVTVKEYIFHMHPELSVMRKENISGWRWKLLTNTECPQGFKDLIMLRYNFS